MSVVEIVWVILCIVLWTAQEILNRRIKKYHYEKWVEFGKPSLAYVLFSLESLSKKFKIGYMWLKYLIKGDSELDADKKIRLMKRINQVILLIGVAVFLFVLIFGIISSFSS